MADILGSQIPLEGRIRNLQGSFTESVNLEISYAVEQPMDVNNPNIHTAVIFDGIITDRNTIEELSSEIVVDSDGSHSLDVRRLPAFAPPVGHIHYAYGDNVYLDWEQSLDTDLDHYLVKKGTSTIATLELCIVDEKYYQPTASGGRYSVNGTSAFKVNQNFTVAFGEGTFDFDGTTYDFPAAGTTYSLPYGVNLTLHDEPGMYDDFDVFIGVQSFVVLNNQPTGENTYTVTPIDGAGNEGTPISKTVWVQALPAAVNFDSETNTITSNWITNSEVRIYADYLPDTDLTMQYIFEESPVMTISDDTVITLPAGTKFYAWPVCDGIQHRTLDMYEVADLTVITGTLNVPADLILTPIAGGDFNLTFTYDISDTDKCFQFHIYDDLTDTILLTHSFNDVSNLWGDIAEYSVDLGLAYATGIPLTVYIKAADSLLEEGEPSETATAVADADAPTIDGDLHGQNI